MTGNPAQVCFLIPARGPLSFRLVLCPPVTRFSAQFVLAASPSDFMTVLFSFGRALANFCHWQLIVAGAEPVPVRILILPRVQEVGTCSGEIGLVASNDREPIPKSGGRDQAVDGGHRFF